MSLSYPEAAFQNGSMLLKNSIPGWKTTVTGYAPKLVSTIFSGLRQSIVSEKWLFASSTEFFNRIVPFRNAGLPAGSCVF
jgi:hypothetical protein